MGEMDATKQPPLTENHLLLHPQLMSCKPAMPSRRPRPPHPPRNCTQPLPVSAAIAGLPRAHDVPIRICLALRPQKHPCPPSPARDRDPRPFVAATLFPCAGLAVSSPLSHVWV